MENDGVDFASKAFPRGKVAADAFPTTDEGAFDFCFSDLASGKLETKVKYTPHPSAEESLGSG